MRDQAERLRLTLQEDGGGAELAFKELLRSELAMLFRQFMDVEEIDIDIAKEEYISVKVTGERFRRVGYYTAG